MTIIRPRLSAILVQLANFRAYPPSHSTHHRIKISFKPDADKIGAGHLWEGIIHRQSEREEHRAKGAQVPDFGPATLVTAVETMRSTVLNTLSHTETSGLVHAEVATAIATVQRVISHQFPKS